MPSVIKCIVKGNKIEEVLLALEPFVLEPPVVQVITDKATSPVKKNFGGTITKAISDLIDSAKGLGQKTITSSELKKFCVSVGASPSSYSYPLRQLVKQKKLKKTNQPSTYEIVK